MPRKKTTRGNPATAQSGTESRNSEVCFKLNGEAVSFPKGTTVIEAAHSLGIDVPFFCYHPGLSPEGNCRMCLVEASNSPKPIPACTTHVADGVEIQTHSEKAKAARADVLEFMLVNHPLDCPICDKSGECLLQDHSYAHGKDHSRMVEQKELKHTKDLGSNIHIWGNRCIVCTRCVRFCDEISGSGELTVVQRGNRSVVDVFPEYPLDNPLSGNVVDICPVGALISKDFLYEARVWYEKKTDSICNGCARGCNIRIETLHNKIKRLVPRHNPAVNDYWMCDRGRHDHDYVLGPNRWLRYRIGANVPAAAGDVLYDAISGVVGRYGPEAVAGVASGFMTLETLYLLRRLFEAFGTPLENIAARVRPGWEARTFKGGFEISGDDNPNRAGVEYLLGAEALGRRAALLDRIRAGELHGLVLFSDLPGYPLEDEWIEALDGIDAAVVFLLEADPRIPASSMLIPATAFSEKDGCLINEDGRVQLMRRATELPRGILREDQILQQALRAGGHRKNVISAAGIFREVGEIVPALEGLTHGDVGEGGHSLVGEGGPS